LIMAVQFPAVDVDAITIVAGNVSLAQASINARYVLELLQTEVPVYEGFDKPLQRKAEPADWFHGADGMGNMNYPKAARPVTPGEADVKLLELFEANPGELILVTLGPLTNIARALEKDASLSTKIKHCFVMGGAACTNGNVTPAAEYNIWCDPEAAHRVFHSGIPITMIGWELSCGEATLSDEEMETILALGTKRAELAIHCNRHALKAVREIQGEAGLALADPVAMAIALDERACAKRSSHYVDISRDEELTRGMTVVDKLDVTGKPANVEVCWTLDSVRWKAMLHEALG